MEEIIANDFWQFKHKLFILFALFCSYCYIESVSKHKQKHGFTIIEVVLVLAIAGLIFLMVFIALPALQRAQRDRERGNNLSEIAAAMQNFRRHNNGRLPGTIVSGNNRGRACFMQSGSGCSTLTDLNGFLSRYTTDFVDPSTGKPYQFVAAGISGSSCKEQVTKMSKGGNLFKSYSFSAIVICYETICGDADVYEKTKDRNSAAIYYNLEAGGAVCVEV